MRIISSTARSGIPVSGLPDHRCFPFPTSSAPHLPVSTTFALLGKQTEQPSHKPWRSDGDTLDPGQNHPKGKWRFRGKSSQARIWSQGCWVTCQLLRQRDSRVLSGLTAWAVETGQCQYFSRTASDKLGHLQYFLSKLGYPPCCCGHPRALGSWVTQKWSSPCMAPSGIPAPNSGALTDRL